MPFIALHPDVGRIDATQSDLGAGLEWSRIYRARPRIPLTCPECAWGVHAKHSPRRVRFFCHDPGRPPSCELSNESWEHHMLKLEMAGAIRAAGWFAELEVPAEDGSWRADVMATSPDGTRRMAWEAQLSPITDADIRARTARYRAEEIAVCWVSPHKRAPNWIDLVPAVRVRAPEDREDQWVVDDGLAGFDPAAGRWECREEGLPQFVRWALLGRLVPGRSLPRYRRVTRRVDGELWFMSRDRWWTSAQSLRAQGEHERMRQRQEEAKKEREARKKERDAAAARRRRRLEELKQRRRAEEARQLRKIREEEHRVRMENLRRLHQEEEARRAVAAAEKEEKARRALETARDWWRRLSKAQMDELFAAVADRAWREEKLHVVIPEKPLMSASFAYGVPLKSQGRVHAMYGIVRPCPDLVALSPQLEFQRLLVRNAEEARELERVMTERARIVHCGLPDHEQLAMC